MYLLLRKVVDETLANSINKSNQQGGKEGTRRERTQVQAKRTQVQAKRTEPKVCVTKQALEHSCSKSSHQIARSILEKRKRWEI